MYENKIDRANLRRQAQRVESYKSLISRQRSTLKNNVPIRKLNPFASTLKDTSRQDNENEQNSKTKHISSPSSSTPSFSSDSSQDSQPNLCTSLKAIQNISYQTELELSSVMTRSATRKYASVGAIHNRVDIDKELKVIKQWPRNISYPIPKQPDELMQLRDVVTRSFNEVLSFCKTAITPENKSQILPEEEVCKSEETADSFIDLFPYLSQDPVLDDGNNENHITFHLNEDYMTHPFVNIIALNEQDQEGTLVIQEEEEEYETITLHSEETYLVDNKCLSNSNCSQINPNDSKTLHPNPFPDNPMMAFYNDHTYAAKSNEKFVAINPEQPQKPPPLNNEENEFKLENALNDLLLNTAILKCLICNETPQEIISQLDKAQSYLDSDSGIL